MKKKLFFAGTALMLAAAATGFAAYDKSNESDLFSANVDALTDNEMGSESTTCYSSYNNCWFWDCQTIYRCGQPCKEVKCDSKSDQGKCR